MDKSQILKGLNELFTDILENEEIVLSNETSAADIEEWDSLNNIQIIVAAEKYFKIRFTLNEFQHWNNVGEMVNTIYSKLDTA